MTLNILLLYFVWTEEYCQNNPNKNKSPNLWHVTSISVCCIFVCTPLPFWTNIISLGSKWFQRTLLLKIIWHYRLQRMNGLYNHNFYLPKAKLIVSSDPIFWTASIIPRHFWAKEFAEISEIRLIYSKKVKQFD